jgi:hypothetical protein
VGSCPAGLYSLIRHYVGYDAANTSQDETIMYLLYILNVPGTYQLMLFLVQVFFAGIQYKYRLIVGGSYWSCLKQIGYYKDGENSPKGKSTYPKWVQDVTWYDCLSKANALSMQIICARGDGQYGGPCQLQTGGFLLEVGKNCVTPFCLKYSIVWGKVYISCVEYCHRYEFSFHWWRTKSIHRKRRES